MWRKLRVILSIPRYGRLAVAIGTAYFILFLVALQDISLGGRGFEFITIEWTRMFSRTGTVTFEPIARLTLPGLTVLLSPINILIGMVVGALAGLNMAITLIALRQPSVCSFNRATGFLASVPALLAGSACCAPAIVLILGLQVSSLFITVFQVLIPVSIVLLLITLKLILDRTNADLIAV